MMYYVYMIICIIEDCKRKKESAVGYCQTHYSKLKRYGDPLGGRSYESHGMREAREYRIWGNMKSRCTNPNTDYYYLYGGRGITVCERWANSFINFYNDMGRCPDPTYSIDRKDVNGNYTPVNCVWASPQDQALNHRLQTNNKSGYRGIVFNKGKNSWRVTLRDKSVGLRKYIGSYKTAEEAAYVRDQVMMQYHEGKDIPLNFEY